MDVEWDFCQSNREPNFSLSQLKWSWNLKSSSDISSPETGIPLSEKIFRLCNDVRRFRGYIIFLRRSTSLFVPLLLSPLLLREKESFEGSPIEGVPLISPVRLYWTSRRDWRVSIIFYFVEIKGNLQLYGLRTAPRRGYSIFNHEFFDSKEVLIFRNFALVPFTRNEIGFDSTDISFYATRIRCFPTIFKFLPIKRRPCFVEQSLNKRNKKNEIKTS